MKILNTIILVLIIGLAIGSGIAKIMLIPEDVAFFTSVGLSKTSIILFGAIQVIGAVFIILKKWRNAGAMILGITFGFSTILIFLSGKISFGLFSLLPLVLILLVVKMNNK
jgi:hypothetical protein